MEDIIIFLSMIGDFISLHGLFKTSLNNQFIINIRIPCLKKVLACEDDDFIKLVLSAHKKKIQNLDYNESLSYCADNGLYQLIEQIHRNYMKEFPDHKQKNLGRLSRVGRIEQIDMCLSKDERSVLLAVLDNIIESIFQSINKYNINSQVVKNLIICTCHFQHAFKYSVEKSELIKLLQYVDNKFENQGFISHLTNINSIYKKHFSNINYDYSIYKL